MSSPSKIKGCGYERELVNYFKEKGLEAKRAWGSNGQALGEHEEVDILLTYPTGQFDRSYPEPNEYVETLKIQCKRKKSIPKVLGLTEHVDCVIYREDNGDSKIMMRLDDFVKRFL